MEIPAATKRRIENILSEAMKNMASEMYMLRRDAVALRPVTMHNEALAGAITLSECLKELSDLKDRWETGPARLLSTLDGRVEQARGILDSFNSFLSPVGNGE